MSDEKKEPVPYDLDDEKKNGYYKWLKTRPDAVRAAGEIFVPWQLYFLTSSNHIVLMYSINEEKGGGISFTVAVIKQFNPSISFERKVFGIKAEDLLPISKEDWEEIFRPLRDKTAPYEPKKSN